MGLYHIIGSLSSSFLNIFYIFSVDLMMDLVMMLCGCSVVEFFTGWGIFRCGKIIEMAELLSRNDNFLLFLNIAIFWFGEGGGLFNF